jgi:hypothetical protein
MPRECAYQASIAVPSSGSAKRGQNGVACVDVGEIAGDDCFLVALRSAPEVAAHWIDRLEFRVA